MKKVLGFILILVLIFSFTTTAYGNEISDMYNLLFTEYTISGTVLQKDYDGIAIELDSPISHPMSMFDIEYGYVEGYWDVSVGDSFSPTEKFQMLDITNDGYMVIGIFSKSVGSIDVTVPEEYISDEQTQQTLDWLTEAAANTKPFSPNTETIIYYGIYGIDEEGPVDEDMDMSLLRLYIDNPGYMYIGAEPPVYDEYYETWFYNAVKKNIQDFKNGGKTIVKNNTYYFPMKEVIEYYGHTVNWTPETGVIISDYIQITSGSNKVKNTRDNIEITLDNNIEIIDGTTYVPIEFLEKTFPENGFKWTTQDRGHGCISIDITQEIAG